jgi:hypothetical protein
MKIFKRESLVCIISCNMTYQLIHFSDARYEDALFQAAQNGREQIVRVLIENAELRERIPGEDD